MSKSSQEVRSKLYKSLFLLLWNEGIQEGIYFLERKEEEEESWFEGLLSKNDSPSLSLYASSSSWYLFQTSNPISKGRITKALISLYGRNIINPIVQGI